MRQVITLRALQKSDDRTQFDCGQPVLNHWFQRHAWSNEKENASRTYILFDQEGERIAGYVTLATGQVERVFLPKSKQRNKPDPVPILLLGQLAISIDYQGQGFSTELLRHAFKVAVEVSSSVGTVALVTHPIDETVRNYYHKWGFETLQSDPDQAMAIFIKDLKVSMNG